MIRPVSYQQGELVVLLRRLALLVRPLVLAGKTFQDQAFANMLCEAGATPLNTRSSLRVVSAYIRRETRFL